MAASIPRLAGAGLALSTWMVALFGGVTLGGAIHLLLLAALAAFPWRELRPAGADPGGRAAGREYPAEERP